MADKTKNMKQNYKKILLIAMMAIGMKANAQCTGCTTTINTADASPHLVGSGQTLCITATGIVSGPITVTPGGTLCNMGTINSTNVWITGGTFNNYGNMNSIYVLVSDMANATNSGTMDVDSLGVTEFNTMLTNNSGGTIINERFAVTNTAVMINNGTMTVDYMADSMAQFNNNLTGSLTVNFDFANAYNSGFFNEGYFKVTRDFFNSTGATFTTSCIAVVSRDWYNSALIGAPAGSCGGFTIANLSLNSGTIGSSAEHVDLCDATHAGPGIDGNSGTIASTTTYCSCTNMCVQGVGINEYQQSSVLISNLYPNPSSNTVSIEIMNDKTEMLSVEVMDMMGRKRSMTTMKAAIGQNKMNLDVATLAQGTYILSIVDEAGAQVKRMFSVVR